MTLDEGVVNTSYLIKEIESEQSIRDFLRTLGCIDDEEITIISHVSDTLIVNVKDCRYAIDEAIAKCIVLYD